jgi:hypothetical protein
MAAAPQPVATARPQSGNNAQMGALLAGAAGIMFVATLAGAYVSVRNWIGVGGEDGFIPTTLKFDNYAGFMTMTSMLSASLAAEWALMSARLNQRRWASAGYGLASIFILASMNIVWFIGQRSGLVASETPYAILFYSLLAAIMLLLAVAVVTAVVTLIRVLGGHVGGSEILHGRAGNWLIHLATLAATVGFFLIYTYR